MKQLACGSVVPGCEAVLQAETEDDLLQQVATHAREQHGMSEVPPEVVMQVRANITDA